VKQQLSSMLGTYFFLTTLYRQIWVPFSKFNIAKDLTIYVYAGCTVLFSR